MMMGLRRPRAVGRAGARGPLLPTKGAVLRRANTSEGGSLRRATTRPASQTSGAVARGDINSRYVNRRARRSLTR